MSDGPSDMARLDKADALLDLASKGGLPGGSDLNAAATRLDAVTAALRGAVRTRAGLLAAARVVLELAGAGVRTAGVPLGSTAIDLAKVALEMAAGERG